MVCTQHAILIVTRLIHQQIKPVKNNLLTFDSSEDVLATGVLTTSCLLGSGLGDFSLVGVEGTGVDSATATGSVGWGVSDPLCCALSLLLPVLLLLLAFVALLPVLAVELDLAVKISFNTNGVM